MSLDADAIVDRRRLRRKLTFWRVIAVAVVVVAVAGAALTLGQRGGLGGAGAYIARVTLSGLIRDDRERVLQLDRLAKSSLARAVIVHIDSPGGTTAGSEQLFDALTRLKAAKPMVIVVDSLAASGGYIAALAGDHIVASHTSLVGSIGVLFQYPNVSDLLDKIGVKVETIKSSPLKASPNGFEPTSPEARAAIDAIVKDSYAWFRGLVRESRHLDDTALEKVADGRVFTGHQGVDLKLVDEIGDERAAIAWLKHEKKVDDRLPVRDYALHSRFSDLPFLHAAAALCDLVGLSSIGRAVDTWSAMREVDTLNLDGLLALWHPAGNN
jgi:protease-4